jgi:hypothetical protein
MRVFGLEHTRKFMAHRFGSGTAADVYDDGMESMDFTGSIGNETIEP